ncbi:MerR family transcriptional regulator [Lactiplantibacillus sp. WILCCON 0030]|uniref:MerR family transcriptional regulator n=1 Tax=Lactiplantibacillus brownii TaxID=3069269 RepID=A0ABU1A740_9LACO|nr:MerR family transcriptional regulator [Lactiplantibacillus brownii]MDQ7936762.1 MerR family transcriptional regulator [Lactiplantibacillus brownii]
MTPNKIEPVSETNNEYTIGTFATLNRISARMLRHYDKIGLFKPQTVLANGYRYYSSKQIPTITLIKRYQACGFTLAEISNLLGASDATIKTLAKEKQRQLAQQDVRQGEADQLLLNLLGDVEAPLPDDGVIAVTQQPERLLLCGQSLGSESEIEVAFDILYGDIEDAHYRVSGLPMLLVNLASDDEAYRVAVPVQQTTVPPVKLTSQTLPSGDYLSTLHYGGYDSLGVVYDRLLRAAQKRQQKPVMPFIERYLLDSTFATNSNDYITEISIKVTP